MIFPIHKLYNTIEPKTNDLFNFFNFTRQITLLPKAEVPLNVSTFLIRKFHINISAFLSITPTPHKKITAGNVPDCVVRKLL